ncbi:uncharacterized protein N0V89_010956 [Didymosphaeria variabile]|uniref:RED-like N-terminal domain-containing protein n=1 Tax=Didymosphaeria variabile TaxID=1932322 RepID=A0A9W8XD60_9PLEO|nr:uncharacterized protein N0V89_010956 [Didymosphaeria variabile]KAJ4347022.1 hypothetical protein N0V89_010956 [Didymosphaeria variabile]
MNNQQFRRLLVDSPGQKDGDASKGQSQQSTRTQGAVLGARKNASIPMTPRQVGRNSIQADFARQLAERNAKANPTKKFRSAAPKGSKLAAGYTDRTKERTDDDADETAQRIKNLEEATKLGQIDRDMFEKLVQEITGGDITATHLVKGLDRKLLERVRKGEDVFAHVSSNEEEKEKDDIEVVEEEFDELAEQDVGSIVREKSEKKGEVAPPKPVAGVKRNRADVLAELKRQREEAAAAAAAEYEKKYPSLGKGFRKVSEKGESSRIEVDKQGREVLIITDAQGKEKRKVRKQKVQEPAPEVRYDLDDEKKPINTHDLPPAKDKQEESEDDDIFEGVGSNFNPLATINSEDESSEEEGETKDTTASFEKPNATSEETTANDDDPDRASTRPTTTVQNPTAKRNYFASSKTFAPANPGQPSESSTADVTVRAALQKVRTLDSNSTLINDADSEESRLKARLAKLAASDRDMEDMDMGFGGSRFDDAEEMEREGEKIKFSEWKGIGAGDDEDAEGGARGEKKRKRGPKKKKGDKNSATDVLKAMERQKEKTLG